MARRYSKRAHEQDAPTRSAFILRIWDFRCRGDPAYLHGGALGETQTLDLDAPPLVPSRVADHVPPSAASGAGDLHRFAALLARGQMNLSYASRSSVEAIP